MTRFTGQSGLRPQTEARRYVYLVLASMLARELEDDEGWMFGGIEDESDRRRLGKAIRAVRVEMKRKGRG
jgi:hypothetical protein